MSKARGATSAVDQVIKLIVGAGQASPSPPVGPALGSKGVKSMDFCKVSYNHRIYETVWMSLIRATVSGIQCQDTTLHRWHTDARPRDGQTGQDFYLRHKDTANIMATSQRGRSTAIQGREEEGREQPRPGDGRDRELETYLRDRQDQAVRTAVIRPPAGGSLQSSHLPGQDDGYRGRGLS